MYNITNVLNTITWTDYFIVLNTESGNILGITIMAVFAIIMFISMLKHGFPNALIASGFVTTLISLVMFGFGGLAPIYIIFPILIMTGGIIGKKLVGD